MIKGRTKHIPPSVLGELEKIKRKPNILTDQDAFNALAKYSKAGREVEKLHGFLFKGDVKRLIGGKKKKISKTKHLFKW